MRDANKMARMITERKERLLRRRCCTSSDAARREGIIMTRRKGKFRALRRVLAGWGLKNIDVYESCRIANRI